MSPVTNGRVIYNEIPTGFPVPGKTLIYDESQTIDLDKEPLHGGILVKVLVLSIDPYQRHRMHDPSIPSYFPAFTVGTPLENDGVGVVVRSENPKYKKGDHVYAMFPFQEYVVLRDAQARVIDNKEGLSWSAYVGVCGMPGKTAHHGWMEYAHPKVQKGDVVFVTAASGAVGAIVAQLAKAEGVKVIASAGSDEKVDYVRSLGVDVAFNYKKVSTREVLQKEGPVNIYWDNVGGESLDAALEFAAQKATFVICGMISSYNVDEPYNVKHLQQLVWREITFNGFLYTSLISKYADEFYKTMPGRVAKGEIKYKEHLVKGLENSAQALLDVLQGNNFGKSSIIVSED
ncbi:NAD(P)-binding protein [Lentinus tigrinus ALCF2SS1-7]|uniref:NAD(P)-binding protein n=1 Tax=Lentinus tigrinus ALCF2SS1-6 TaxID=1328759 RepID=A0A5C2RSY9_9APHY|nr:NAD(P)-binding protein [Lentinus tigrinus ALCF2SS1-6]RPD69944.1 NAD(P)-binding protein [Lentinus tigrinus ALCF2SS1-7]